jgi:hypothetical protein
VLDPASTSRNFETTGKNAYLYYTQFHTQNCQQGPDRDLVRVPITISRREGGPRVDAPRAIPRRSNYDSGRGSRWSLRVEGRER